MDANGKLIAVIGDEVFLPGFMLAIHRFMRWTDPPPLSIYSFPLLLYRQDTVTGFLLAGVGHRTAEKTNFLVVKPGLCKEL